MNDPNSFGYRESGGGGGAAGRPGLGPNALAQYKFSTDEMRVLHECNNESFFQRSLPLSTLFGFGTFAAVQKGHLKPNPRFGAFPKVTLAVAVGYFVGKLSYQQACAEKLMALPGSYIGQLLRDRRDGKVDGITPPPISPSSMLGATTGDIYSDAGLGSSLNLDTDRPSFSIDSYRPEQDNPNGQPPGVYVSPGVYYPPTTYSTPGVYYPPVVYTPQGTYVPVVGVGPLGGAPEPAPQRSYDDLRRENRGDFAQNKQDPYRVDGNMGPAPPAPRRAPPPPAGPATNKYGDALD